MVLPESITTRFYVTTIDSGKPNVLRSRRRNNIQFGGSVGKSYKNSYFAVTNDLTNNSNHESNVSSTCISKQPVVTTFSKTTNAGDEWQFGDNAPVENAWRS